MEPGPEPAAERKGLVRLGLGQKSSFSRKPLRLLRGEVVGLGEVVRQVVEFPDVLVRVPALQARPGGRAVQGTNGPKVQANQPSW